VGRPIVVGCWLAVLTLVFCWRCYRTFDIFSNTTDEPAHIACGLEVWQSGRYTLEPQHPPLARMILALPAYLAGLRQHDLRIWTRDDLAFYWRTLRLARLGNLVFAPLLLVGVYRWARDLYDSYAALAAATVVSLCPNLLAHASLATLDFGAAVTTFVAAYCFWRWSLARDFRSCLYAAVAFAAAVATKFSAMFFLPPLALVFFVISLRQQPVAGAWSRPAIVRQGLAFLGTVAVLVWATYLFNFGPLPPIRIYAPPRTLGQYYASALEVFVAPHRVPAPAFWRGLADVLGHNPSPSQ
jgi:dolichyl-phosphate-mannose--protein O-mannosyl transferase